MAAALKTIKKMPANSGSTEEQRGQYMQEVYEAGMPEHIRQKMLAERSRAGQRINPASERARDHAKPRSASSTAKTSSGCMVMIAATLLAIGLSTVFFLAR